MVVKNNLKPIERSEINFFDFTKYRYLKKHSLPFKDKASFSQNYDAIPSWN